MKIAIIGAGINGLYLAWKLSEKGHKVAVFEKKEKIGKEQCSGFFSERLFDFIPKAKKIIQNKIDYILINYPRKQIRIEPQRQFFIMNHAELDRLAAGLAMRAGAEILLGREMREMPQGFDRVIGCDGYNSFVRRMLGIGKPDFRFTIQGFIEEENRDNFVETWAAPGGFTPHHFFRKDGAGFIWKIPRGEETEYGIMAGPQKAKPIFDDFVKKRGLKLERTMSSVVPQGFLIPNHKSITLCGDAAGLAKPWSGGGVIWGLMAAGILLKNFPDFIKYRNDLKKSFLVKILFSKLATKMSYFIGFNFPFLLPKKIKIEGDFLM